MQLPAVSLALSRLSFAQVLGPVTGAAMLSQGVASVQFAQ